MSPKYVISTVTYTEDSVNLQDYIIKIYRTLLASIMHDKNKGIHPSVVLAIVTIASQRCLLASAYWLVRAVASEFYADISSIAAFCTLPRATQIIRYTTSPNLDQGLGRVVSSDIVVLCGTCSKSQILQLQDSDVKLNQDVMEVAQHISLN